ncbi:MAG: type II toxin-antitoxin system RelE/ParE family toxin [Bacteroidota bacterium]
MIYTIEIQEEAIEEMREAFCWYESRQQGLGYSLLSEIELCYQRLSENPQHYTSITDRFRRIRTDIFPYMLVYEIEGDRVIVISFFHAKRGVV